MQTVKVLDIAANELLIYEAEKSSWDANQDRLAAAGVPIGGMAFQDLQQYRVDWLSTNHSIIVLAGLSRNDREALATLIHRAPPCRQLEQLTSEDVERLREVAREWLAARN